MTCGNLIFKYGKDFKSAKLHLTEVFMKSVAEVTIKLRNDENMWK